MSPTPVATPISKPENLPLSAESLRSLFFLVNGRPDSQTKTFSKQVIVGVDDIKNLGRMIREKLEVNHVASMVEHVDVNPHGGKIMNFSSIEQFSVEDWKLPRQIDSLLIRWEFLFLSDKASIPQKHTVTLRINASDIKTIDVLQACLMNDEKDLEKLDLDSSVMFCRVDFINSILGDELIKVVEKWNDGLVSGVNQSKTYNFFTARKHLFARIGHYTSILFMGALSIIAMSVLSISPYFTEAVHSDQMAIFGYWLIFSAIGVLFAHYFLGWYIGFKIFSSFNESSKHHPFRITTKDSEMLASVISDRRKEYWSAMAWFFGNLLVNVVGSYLFFLLMSYFYGPSKIG